MERMSSTANLDSTVVRDDRIERWAFFKCPEKHEMIEDSDGLSVSAWSE